MQLVEKYRPKKLTDIVGQEKVVEIVRRVMERKGFDRGAFWIEGPTGTGKTSLAWAMARSVGCNEFCIEEIDGEKCSVDRVRAIDETICLAGLMGGGWKAYIVNEAHAMTSRAVQAWLTLLERLPSKRIVIFTTTVDSGDMFGGFTQPFLDRTISLRLTKIGLSEKFAALARKIAKAEGLDGRPPAAYRELMGKCHNSMRAALMAIERGDMLKVEHSPAIKKMIKAGKTARTRRKKERKTL